MESTGDGCEGARLCSQVIQKEEHAPPLSRLTLRRYDPVRSGVFVLSLFYFSFIFLKTKSR